MSGAFARPSPSTWSRSRASCGFTRSWCADWSPFGLLEASRDASGQLWIPSRELVKMARLRGPGRAQLRPQQGS
jgi:hypothetical protein